MEKRICPLCGKTYTEYPALSRRDNKTEICPACGTREALEDYCGFKGEARQKRQGEESIERK